MRTIYFGGFAGPSPVAPAELTSIDLDTLPAEEFYELFAEWVVQCWIEENTVPNDRHSLAAFDIRELIPQFRKQWAAGDWKRVHPRRGATLEQCFLWWQMTVRLPLTIVINAGQPQQPTGRIRHKLLLPPYELGACLAQNLHVVGGSEPPFQLVRVPLLLFDGQIGHAVTARSIDDTHDWIGYDDPTWRTGSSMLCAGQNALGVDAQYYGNNEIGQWVVALFALSMLIYALPIPQDDIELWRVWAKEARELMDHIANKH